MRGVHARRRRVLMIMAGESAQSACRRQRAMKAQTLQALVRGALARRQCALLRVARAGGALGIPADLAGGGLPVTTVGAVGALACPIRNSIAAHLALLLRVCWHCSYVLPSPLWYRLAPPLLSPLIHLLSRAPSPLPDPSPMRSFGLSSSDTWLTSTPSLLRGSVAVDSIAGLALPHALSHALSQTVWRVIRHASSSCLVRNLLLGQPCIYHLLPERGKHDALAGPVKHAQQSIGAATAP